MKPKLLDEPLAEYLARKETSGGNLNLFMRDRRAFVRQVLNGKPAPPATPEMNHGSHMHALILEPDTVGERFVVPPRRHDLDESLFGTPWGAKLVDRRTKAGRAAWEKFQESVGDRIVVEPELWDRAPRMLRAAMAHEEAASLLFGPDGENERTCIFTEPEHGRDMRVRFDRIKVQASLVVELKICHTLTPDAVAWQWYRLGYHRKAALYLDAAYATFGRNFSFRLVCIESSEDPEPEVAVYPLDTDSAAVMGGRREYQDAIQGLQACEESGDWRTNWVAGREPYPLPGPIQSKFEYEEGAREEAAAITMGGVPLGV